MMIIIVLTYESASHIPIDRSADPLSGPIWVIILLGNIIVVCNGQFIFKGIPSSGGDLRGDLYLSKMIDNVSKM